MDDRPNPDQLLADLKNENAVGQSKLKVFLGMCPGVGKTYAMLQVARQLLKEGVDVVVGLVETHGRTETEALLEGLEIIPRKNISYRGVKLEEMDIDAILARRPWAVMVDELPHTNVPGSRHPKRYQDVMELLDAGISVYTTLNIQHIESRVDIIRQITGATVHERVPDSILDLADEIKLIDLTPEELKIRLEDGKVYLGDRAANAAVNFFKPENLAALREMALRFTAERADQDLRDVMKERKISGPWKSTERLLVGIGPSPSSESLVRWTRRMADTMNCAWIAVYIESDLPLESDAKERVTHHLSLARQLGAEIIITSGFDISETLVRVAKEQNATQIVIGKPLNYSWWSWLKGKYFVDRLMSKSEYIDIYIVQAEKKSHRKGKPENFRQIVFPSNEYLVAGLSTVILTVFSLFLVRFTGYSTIALLYLLLVVGLGLKLSRWPVIATAAASAFLWNFLFVPPIFTLRIRNLDDSIMFVTFFLVALAMGNLTSRLRLKEITEHKREKRIEALYELARQATLAEDINSGLEAALRLIESTLNVHASLYLRLPNHGLSTVSHPASSFPLSEKERSVADWAFNHKKNAGKFTDTLPDSEALHLPLQARIAVMGVLSIRHNTDKTFDMAEYELLEAFSGLVASILEKDHLIQAIKYAEVYEASKRVRQALLDSVSMELKTPLGAISEGMKELLLKAKDNVNLETVHDINIALRRLNSAINNLLNMSRIQAGIEIKPEWCDISGMVKNALELTQDTIKGHVLAIEIDNNLPSVKLDQSLIVQCIYHLLANAARWTKQGKTITIRAKIRDHKLFLYVLDEGPGIKQSDINRIFDKFYRSHDNNTDGIGLGLSIVDGFVRAHGGTVSVKNRYEGGAEFEMAIPVEIK